MILLLPIPDLEWWQAYLRTQGYHDARRFVGGGNYDY